MSISVISFTGKGMLLSDRLALLWEKAGEAELELFTKCSRPGGEGLRHPVRFVEQSVRAWAGERMRKGQPLVFVGACGIAVRAIAPWVSDKLYDSPVLVMDEQGAYVIPILSGHVGGANRLAEKISKRTGVVAVITTATDINHRFAVDLFAQKNGLYPENREGIARVSARILSGEEVTFAIEPERIRKGSLPPEGVRLLFCPPKGSPDVVVSGRGCEKGALLTLRPRQYVVGMGCRKGKEAEKIEALVCRTLKKAGILPEEIWGLASLSQKREEPGLNAFSRKYHVPFVTFTARQLKEVEGVFQSSAFVLSAVGVDNVCERAALKLCGVGGELICPKHGEDGMTIAIARRQWSVTFDEE